MCIAFVDPGNLEADLQTGSRTGYELLWVLLMSTVMGFLLQSLASRLGVATGEHLASLCRRRYGNATRYALWIMAELAVIGSDIQEVVGTALALSLLSRGHITLPVGVALAAVTAFALLLLERAGMAWLEASFQVLVGVMAVSMGVLFFAADVPYAEAAKGMIIPKLRKGYASIACGLLGAIIMPHNLFLHSALVATRPVMQRHAVDHRGRILRVFSARSIAPSTSSNSLAASEESEASAAHAARAGAAGQAAEPLSAETSAPISPEEASPTHPSPLGDADRAAEAGDGDVDVDDVDDDDDDKGGDGNRLGNGNGKAGRKAATAAAASDASSSAKPSGRSVTFSASPAGPARAHLSALGPAEEALSSEEVGGAVLPCHAPINSRKWSIRYYAIESAMALFVTLFINAAVIGVFAAGFAGTPAAADVGLANAGAFLGRRYGDRMEVIWGVGLLAAGQSATMTGTYAGQFIMAGFLDIRMSAAKRAMLTRGIAIGPTLLVAAFSKNERALDRINEWINIFQSVQLPFAVVPLLVLTSSTAIMGRRFVNGPVTAAVAIGAAGIILSINTITAAEAIAESLPRSYLLRTLIFSVIAGYVSLIVAILPGVPRHFAKVQRLFVPSPSSFRPLRRRGSVEGTHRYGFHHPQHDANRRAPFASNGARYPGHAHSDPQIQARIPPAAAPSAAQEELRSPLLGDN